MKFILAMIVLLPSGQLSITNHEQPNLEQCWRLAHQFVTLDPAQFGGISLGAGCLVQRGEKS